MATERFAKFLGRALDRRGFMGKVGAGAVGVTAGALGFSGSAQADEGTDCYNVLCCCVCLNVPVGPPCSGPIYCTWTWTCCSGGKRYRCVEGYGSQVACNPPSGNCNKYIECSAVIPTGTSC